MQILVIVVGIALVVVGLLFAIQGHGADPAAGGARGFNVEGPAWLLLVAFGAALILFGAVYDFGAGAGDARAGQDAAATASTAPSDAATTTTRPSATTRGVTTTTRRATTTEPEAVAGCQVTISNPLAAIHEEPDVFSQEIVRVPAGVYNVEESRVVTFVSDQRWFLISVSGRDGWIRDSTFDIAGKSADCP